MEGKMENQRLHKKDQLQKRRDRQRQIDEAMIRGILTLDNMMAIQPSETSSEHHQMIVRRLTGKTIETAYNQLSLI